jgi:uncharacterized protein YndB with AHSA1/START domain
MTNIDHSPMLIEERLFIAAPVEDVWSLIADPELMAAWSPEVQRITWIGAADVSVGGIFHGHNRVGPVRWHTRNVIEFVNPVHKFGWRTMNGPGNSLMCRWTYHLESQLGGCDVIERFEATSWPAVGITSLLWARGLMIRKGMRATLQSVKQAAENPAIP